MSGSDRNQNSNILRVDGQLYEMTGISKDHIISSFPKQFLRKGKYLKNDFSLEVKQACQKRTIVSSHDRSNLRSCKVVLVGDAYVGKTCIVRRFVENKFEHNYKMTIGVDFSIQKFSVLSIPFNLFIWDTAGQDKFRCIAANYYRGAHVVLVVFDLNDILSLHTCSDWLKEALRHCDDPLKFLVGTKKDLLTDVTYRHIESEAIQVAEDLGAEYWAVSSASGDNIQAMFKRVAATSFDQSVIRELQPTESTPNVVKGLDIRTLDPSDANLCEREPKKKCCKV